MSRRDYFKEENKLKKISIVFAVTLAVTVVVFMYLFSLYNKRLEENARQSILELGKINAVVPNQNQISLASISQDKGINEVQNEIATNEVESSTNTVPQEIAKHEIPEESETAEKENVEGNVVDDSVQSGETVSDSQPADTNSFIAPVNGEIIKDFAIETLVYSKTLDEWTVHNGIDIKAPKTTVVVASANGVIESIKNDPRYGLTVIITHDGGFKTIYANLLTAEFVSEGQIIEKGQTIGTVGETASFEIAEEAHLHFEMLKDRRICKSNTVF